MKNYSLTLHLLAILALSHGFTNTIPIMKNKVAKRSSSRSTSLNMVYSRVSRARTCIRNFLTQRSVQSFMFLQDQCRDPHTVDWIEKFVNSTQMLSFHGTGKFDLERYGNWDTIFLEMMQQEADEVIVSVKRRGKGRGGWSKNNPYIQDRYVEYKISIDPPSLASRILSVREQIAREWVHDLDIIAQNGEAIIESYFENRAKERDDAKAVDKERSDNPEEDLSTDEENSKFNRDSMSVLLELADFSSVQGIIPSPLRKGNFDLLLLLSTQESIHRILFELKESGEDAKQHFEWFRSFYFDRIPKYFDGSGKYGRYDDFLEDLFVSSPSVKQAGKKMVLIDPVGLAEKLLLTRAEVASEWKEMMVNVPLDHIDLRRNLLTNQLDKVDLVTEEPLAAEVDKVDTPYGEFE